MTKGRQVLVLGYGEMGHAMHHMYPFLAEFVLKKKLYIFNDKRK